MAFDPGKYKVKAPKPLPVLLLLDTSGSMRGEKLIRLQEAVSAMTKTFAEEAARETVYKISVITFGGTASVHTEFTDAQELYKRGIPGLFASGGTPLGGVLSLAKSIIEDRDKVPSNVYRPAVILVSDGLPGDNWKPRLDEFISSGRSSKCQRFSVAIGSDASKDILMQFCGLPENLYYADTAADIAGCFSQVTMSVSMRVKSGSPDSFPAPNSAPMSISAIDEDEDEDI